MWYKYVLWTISRCKILLIIIKVTVSPNVETSAWNRWMNRRYKMSRNIGLKSMWIHSMQQVTHGGTLLVLLELLRLWIFFSLFSFPRIQKNENKIWVLDVCMFRKEPGRTHLRWTRKTERFQTSEQTTSFQPSESMILGSGSFFIYFAADAFSHFVTLWKLWLQTRRKVPHEGILVTPEFLTLERGGPKQPPNTA